MPGGKREYPERPIIGVGGIIFDGGNVLLVKRNKEPGRGEWSLPGGAVELGETLIEGLKREIWEEASLSIEVGGLVRLLDRIIYDQNRKVQYHYVLADYWGRVVSGLAQPASDICDLRFVPVGELGNLDIHEEVKETILMALAMKKEKSPS